MNGGGHDQIIREEDWGKQFYLTGMKKKYDSHNYVSKQLFTREKTNDGVNATRNRLRFQCIKQNLNVKMRNDLKHFL